MVSHGWGSLEANNVFYHHFCGLTLEAGGTRVASPFTRLGSEAAGARSDRFGLTQGCFHGTSRMPLGDFT